MDAAQARDAYSDDTILRFQSFSEEALPIVIEKSLFAPQRIHAINMSSCGVYDLAMGAQRARSLSLNTPATTLAYDRRHFPMNTSDASLVVSNDPYTLALVYPEPHSKGTIGPGTTFVLPTECPMYVPVQDRATTGTNHLNFN